MAVATAGLVAILAAAGPSSSKASDRRGPAGRGALLVGAASRSVLPLVGDGLDYLDAGFPDRQDP